MLGTSTPLALQRSYKGESHLEGILSEIVKAKKGREGPFRSIICNDEMVFESYNIPMDVLEARKFSSLD